LLRGESFPNGKCMNFFHLLTQSSIHKSVIDSASVALGASWRYDSRQGIASEKRFSR
jgi:hypothetical protein